MNAAVTVPPAVGTALLDDFSLEMTGKDVPKLEEAYDSIPAGTRINVTFLAGEDLGTRLAAVVPGPGSRRSYKEHVLNAAVTVPPAVGTALLDDFSLEMTGKDVPKLEEAYDSIPAGTRINVTFLAGEDLGTRLAAARAVKRLGFVPVPHISARRLPSRAHLEEFLAGLARDDTAENVFVVGGDPARPEGPYEDALSVIRTGLLQEYGVRHTGVSGYPEGHPAIADGTLWSALTDKAAALGAGRLSGDVITQFGFDVDPVLGWIEAARARGVDLPVRIGVPGPAGVRRLLGYATRFGVATSASVARKYGFSLTNLMGTTGPDRFLDALAERYDPARHGVVKVHFYTFGGLRATSEWVTGFRARG